MARIFLSYASESHNIADQINLSLISRGHDVFFDRDDLPDGENFEQQIEAGLKRSDFMIFLVSPHSIESGRYTRTELKYARAKWPNPDGRVLPVMVSPTPMSDVPAYLKAVGIMQPAGSPSAEIASAIDQMNRNVRRKGRGLRVGVMATAVAAVLAGAVYLNLDRMAAMISGSTIEPTITVQQIGGECSGDQVYEAIAQGELTYAEAKAVGEACAETLISATAKTDPGGDRRAAFAVDFATSATSTEASERRAAAAVIQGNTVSAVESFFVLARAATTPLTKARHFRSAAVMAFNTNPELAIEALEQVVLLEPDDLNAWMGLSTLYRTIGDQEKAEQVAGELRDRAGGGGVDWQASARLEEARRQITLGNRAQAESNMMAARGLFEQTGNRWGIAQTMLFETDFLLSQGNAVAARAVSDDALTLAQTYLFPDIAAQAKTAKARSYMMTLETEKAAGLFEEAQAEFESLNNPYGVAYVVSQRGFIAMNQMKPREARDLFKDSKEKMAAMGNLEGTAWAEYNIGNAEFALGDMQSAENAYVSAQSIFAEMGMQAGEVSILISLAGVRGYQGRPDQALEYFDQARMRARQAGLPTEEAQALFGAAVLHRTAGDIDQAEAKYLAALDLYEQSKNALASIFTLEQLGQMAAIRGADTEARAYWQRGLEISQSIGQADATRRIEYELSRLD